MWMDDTAHTDLFRKRESTPAPSNERIATSQEDLSDRLAQAREHLDSLLNALSEGPSASHTVVDPKAKIEWLTTKIEIRDVAVARPPRETRGQMLERPRADAEAHLGIERALSRIEALERLLDDRQAMVEALVRERDWALAERDALRDNLAQRRDAVEGAGEQVRTLEKTVSALRSELHCLLVEEAQLASTEELSEELNGRDKALGVNPTAGPDGNEDALAAASRAAAELAKHAASRELGRSSTSDAPKVSASELAAEVESLRAQKVAAVLALEETRLEMDTLRCEQAAHVEAAAQRTEALERAVEALRAERAETGRVLEETRSSLASLEAQLAALREEMASAREAGEEAATLRGLLQEAGIDVAAGWEEAVARFEEGAEQHAAWAEAHAAHEAALKNLQALTTADSREELEAALAESAKRVADLCRDHPAWADLVADEGPEEYAARAKAAAEEAHALREELTDLRARIDRATEAACRLVGLDEEIAVARATAQSTSREPSSSGSPWAAKLANRELVMMPAASRTSVRLG